MVLLVACVASGCTDDGAPFAPVTPPREPTPDGGTMTDRDPSVGTDDSDGPSDDDGQVVDDGTEPTDDGDDGELDAGIDAGRPHPQRACILDPDKVYMGATLKIGNSDHYAIAAMDDPEHPCFGLSVARGIDGFIRPTDGQFVYLETVLTDGPFVRELHNDDLEWFVTDHRWSVPNRAWENDPILEVPETPDSLIRLFGIPNSSSFILGTVRYENGTERVLTYYGDGGDRLPVSGELLAVTANGLMLTFESIDGDSAPYRYRLFHPNGDETEVTGMTTLQPITARAHGDGFWVAVPLAGGSASRWFIADDGTSTKDGDYAEGGGSDQLISGALDADGALYNSRGDDSTDGMFEVYRRRLLPGTTELLFSDFDSPEWAATGADLRSTPPRIYVRVRGGLWTGP